DPKVIEKAAAKMGPTADNVERITTDMRSAMSEFRASAKRLDAVLARMDRTFQKVESIDEEDLREFLQIQGVRVNLIPDSSVTSRVKQLRQEEAAPPPEPR